MKILIDMNLSPDWVKAFVAKKIDSIHWSTVGDPRPEDDEIMSYARANDHIVFTHDLDFGTILALTQASSPSVIQILAQNILPDHLANSIVSVLGNNKEILKKASLITVDESRARVRILPLHERS